MSALQPVPVEGSALVERCDVCIVGAGGTPVSNVARESARRFDGSNEQEVASWLRAQYGVWSTPETGNLLSGVLSELENMTIATGLNDVIMDYLVDIVDRGAATELVFRSGATKAISPGSWIVNCTGYVLKTDYPYDPYVSDGGRWFRFKHANGFCDYRLRSSTSNLSKATRNKVSRPSGSMCR